MKKLLFILIALSVFSCTSKQNSAENETKTDEKPEITQNQTLAEPENKTDRQVQSSESSTKSEKVVSPQTYPYKATKSLIADQELNNFLETYEPKKQIQKIDNRYNQVVMGKKGITCVFPAGCFDLKNPSDSVQIELIEYMNPSDFLFGGLGTVCEGKMLETGGTAYINATVNGEKVALKKDYLIAFQKPKKVKKDMQFFTGVRAENKEIDWKVGTETLKTENLSGDLNDFFTPEEIKGKIPYPTELYERGTDGNSLENFKKRNTDSDALGFLFFDKFISSREEYADENLEGMEIICQDLFHKASFIFKNKPIDHRNDIILSDIKVKKLLEGKSKALSNNAKMVFKMADSKPPYKIRKTKDLTEFIRTKISQSNTFATKQLGWINCDRFPASVEKQQFAFELSNMKSAQVQLYFPSMYSFLPIQANGNQFSSAIPKGERIKVVIFGINDKNEKVMSCQEVENSQSNPSVKNEFVPFSKETFEKLLGS
ncbi:MAG: hypothetical protein EAZ97_04345 [Bacteroidetes bacterium]|nr:MAG: hypothetical protein EAZ97_04345 [Bacteroidota bacterium]